MRCNYWLDKKDPFFILESQKGHKVVFCSEERPEGGQFNGNWVTVVDGIKRDEAINFSKELNKELNKYYKKLDELFDDMFLDTTTPKNFILLQSGYGHKIIMSDKI